MRSVVSHYRLVSLILFRFVLLRHEVARDLGICLAEDTTVFAAVLCMEASIMGSLILSKFLRE